MKVSHNKLEKFIIFIIGIRRTISTSKIKKMIPIKKNCKENGRRALVLGSNPHSNGEFFSLSENVFFDVRLRIERIKIIIKADIKNNKKIIIIIYTKFRFFDWNSNIIFILCKYLPHQ